MSFKIYFEPKQWEGNQQNSLYLKMTIPALQGQSLITFRGMPCSSTVQEHRPKPTSKQCCPLGSVQERRGDPTQVVAQRNFLKALVKKFPFLTEIAERAEVFFLGYFCAQFQGLKWLQSSCRCLRVRLTHGGGDSQKGAERQGCLRKPLR